MTHNFRILLKGTLAFHSSMAALFSASVKGFTPGGMLAVDCTSVKKMRSFICAPNKQFLS